MNIRLWLAIPLIAIVLGCATTPQKARENDIRRRLADTIIPEIEFRQAEAYCPLAFLQEMSRTNDTDAGINFVVMKPDDVAPLSPNSITLEAHNISVGDALNIICELGGLSWVIEDSVVKVRPKTRKVQRSSSP